MTVWPISTGRNLAYGLLPLVGAMMTRRGS